MNYLWEFARTEVIFICMFSLLVLVGAAVAIWCDRE